MVDTERLGNAVVIGGVRVVPPFFEFLEFKIIGGVAVDLVRAHEEKGLVRAVLPGRLEQVERAQGVDLEIVERPRRGQVVAGLGRAVNGDVELFRFEKAEYGVAVADVEVAVDKVPDARLEAPEGGPGVAARAEEIHTHVVVNAEHRVEVPVHLDDAFGTDEAAGARDEQFHDNPG
jgi:hypothetical protein